MTLSLFTRRAALASCLALAAALALPAGARAAEITIFAAASLKNALDEIAADWSAETGNTATISYGSSGTLAKQIIEGAPADLFISAASNWMDKLEEAKLIDPASRVDLLGNTLVLVAHGKDAAKVEIGPGFDLAGLLGDNKLAMGLLDSVPAGQYGKEALTSLGIWPAVEPKVAQVENVRAALALVATGEAPFGIVYATDAHAEPRVSVVGTFPDDTHPPIVYPVALTTQARPGSDFRESSPGSQPFPDYGRRLARRARTSRSGSGPPSPWSSTRWPGRC